MISRKPLGHGRSRPKKLDRANMGNAVAKPGWDAQEEGTAKAVPGGKRVRGSGCARRSSRKSDVTSPLWRVEDKTTTGRALRVERDDLEKIVAEALREGQNPALTFGWDRDGGKPRDDWMAFPQQVASVLMHVTDAVLQGDFEEASELAKLLGKAE